MRLMKSNLIKILGVLLVTGGFCVGIAWWVQKNSAPANLSSSLLDSFASKDTDHDGLSDNMESIYGTNYNDPDSDGDGFLDGEEVLSGYDPLKPSPNDQLNTNYTVIPRPAAGSIKNLNFTDNLIAQLTEKVTSGEIQPLKSGDATTISNPSSVEEAMQAAIQRSYQEFNLPNIPSDQLNISADNSEEAIKEYARQMSMVLKPINGISAIDFDKGTKSIIDVVNISESTANQIKKIKVPSDLISVHKKQIGMLIMQSNILKSIVNSGEDPLKATIAISQIENIKNVTQEILNETENVLKSHNM